MTLAGKSNIVFLLPYEANFHSAYGGAVVQWVGEVVRRSKGHDYTVIARRLNDGGVFDKPLSNWASRAIFKNYCRRTALGGFMWCLLNIRHWRRQSIALNTQYSYGCWASGAEFLSTSIMIYLPILTIGTYVGLMNPWIQL